MKVKRLSAVVIVVFLMTLLLCTNVYADTAEDAVENVSDDHLVEVAAESIEQVPVLPEYETADEPSVQDAYVPEAESEPTAKPAAPEAEEIGESDNKIENIPAEEVVSSPAQESPNYTVTVSNASGSVDLNGGAETSIADILSNLGYTIDENTVIEVDHDSVDTSVIAVNKTESGLMLSDFGPFSKADRNLIVYINGEAVELTVVDPVEISGDKTAAEIETAFSNAYDGNVRLTGDVNLIAESGGELRDIVLKTGVHDLYLNGKTLNLNGMAIVLGQTNSSGEVISSATLNIYGGADSTTSGAGIIKTDENGSSSAMQSETVKFCSKDVSSSVTGAMCGICLDGGNVNIYSGTVEISSSVNEIISICGVYTGTGTASVYGGTIKTTAEGSNIVAACGIYVDGGTANIYGGNVTVTAKTQSTDSSATACGIQMMSGTANIQAGTVTAESTAADSNNGWSYGLKLLFGGTVNMDGGSVIAQNTHNAYAVGVDAGTFNLYSGTIKAIDSISSIALHSKGGQTDIHAGTLYACTKNGTKSRGLDVYGGTVNVYSGTITADTSDTSSAVVVSSGILNIHNASISAKSSSAAFGIVALGGTGNFYNGTVSAVGTMAAGIYSEGGTFNLYGGTITVEQATVAVGAGIFNGSESAGTVNIYGGTINAVSYCLASGIELKGSKAPTATANIYDGIITATILDITNQYSSISSYAVADPEITGNPFNLSDKEGMTLSEDSKTAFALYAIQNSIVNVCGGSFTANTSNGDKSKPASAVLYGIYLRKSAVAISGGSFIGDISETSYKDKKLTITGGRYTADPSAYVADGYLVNDYGSDAEYRYEVYEDIAVLPAYTDFDVDVISEVDLNDAQRKAISSLQADIVSIIRCTYSGGTGEYRVVLKTTLLKGHDASTVHVWFLAEDGTLTEVEFEINADGEIVISHAESGVYLITA